MSIDDPFASADEGARTIIRPNPGGRRPLIDAELLAPTAPPVIAPALIPQPALADQASVSRGAGLNPLEAAAEPLLSLIMRLKNTVTHPEPERLRQRMMDEIQTFSTTARNAGVDEKTVFRARYVLCTTLDEVVLNTPWGRASDWSENSLLITFHNETWGGEKVFELLDAIIQDPRKNLDLLELTYLCLAFGFQGRYRLLENGRSRLEEQRERTYNAIRSARGDFERELSPHWRANTQEQNPLVRYVPLWVVGAVAAALLLLAYALFSWLLNRASDPVFSAMSSIGADKPPMVQRSGVTAPLAAPKPQVQAARAQVAQGLRQFLQPQISQGLLDVIEDNDKTTIRIRGDGLFDSGKAEIKPAFLALLTQIGQELNTTQGRVLVTGHSDNVPISNLQFPSNWHLSKARADSVSKLLAAVSNNPTRFISEGRADSEPLAPNTTPPGRAQNRRVDVVLMGRAQ